MGEGGMNTSNGGVFSEQLEGGRAGAQVHVGPEGIKASTAEGRHFVVPYAELHLERGGASGKMLFCKNRDRSLSIFTEDVQVLRNLRRSGNRRVLEQLRQIDSEHRTKGMRTMALLLLTGLILLGAVLLLPSLWRSMREAAVNAIPNSVDKNIGKMAIESMDLGGQEIKNPRVVKAIQRMVDRLAEQVPDKDLKFETRVLRHEQQNAFALPGGQIVVFSGLMQQAEKPEEVAGVLAHEIAHVTERHGIERLVQGLGVIGALQLLLGDVGGLLATAGELLTLAAINSYSRDQESEADREGVALMHRAQLNPAALADFLQKLGVDATEQGEAETPSEDAERETEKDSGLQEVGESIAGWLGTHPQTEARVEAIREQVRALPPQNYQGLEIDWAAIQAALNPPGSKQGVHKL